MDVILDTNVYDEDLFLRKPDYTALIAYLRRTRSQLLIPEITKREVSKHLRKVAQTDLSRLKTNSAVFTKLIDYSPPTLDFTVEHLQKYHDRQLRRAPRNIIKTPQIELETVVSRSLTETPPFRKSDKGMRDTIFWLTILDYLKNVDSRHVALISNDQGDFGRDNTLKKELINELIDLELKDRLSFYSTVGEFLSVHANPIQYIDEDLITEAIESEIEYYADILDFDEVEIDFTGMPYAYDIDSVEYSGLFDLEDFYIYSETSSEYIIYAEVSLNFEVELSYMLGEKQYNSSSSSFDYKTELKREDTTGISYLELFITIDKKTKTVKNISDSYTADNLAFEFMDHKIGPAQKKKSSKK